MVAKRGRPLSERTKELKRIEEMLKNPPSHIRNLPPCLFTQDLIEGLAAGRKAVLKGYSSAIKHELIYRLHDFLEDDPSQYPDAEATKEYKGKLQVVTDGQKEGGKVTKNKSADLAKQVCENNKDLLDRRKPQGNLTIHGISTTIHDEWCTRGVNIEGKQKKPDVKTIRRWINTHIKNNSK